MSKVKIACKSCKNCGPAKKKLYDGRSAEVKGRVTDHPELVDLEPEGGDVKGEARWCPPTNLIPIDGLKTIDTTKKDEPPPPPPKPQPRKAEYVDFGYGPVCKECRAGKGEGHSRDCSSCPESAK